LVGFTNATRLACYTIPRCWAPHTQTQMHGELAMKGPCLSIYLSIYVSIYLSTYLPIYLSIYLGV